MSAVPAFVAAVALGTIIFALCKFVSRSPTLPSADLQMCLFIRCPNNAVQQEELLDHVKIWGYSVRRSMSGILVVTLNAENRDQLERGYRELMRLVYDYTKDDRITFTKGSISSVAHSTQ